MEQLRLQSIDMCGMKDGVERFISPDVHAKFLVMVYSLVVLAARRPVAVSLSIPIVSDPGQGLSESGVMVM